MEYGIWCTSVPPLEGQPPCNSVLLVSVTKRIIQPTSGLRELGYRRDAVEPSIIVTLESNQFGKDNYNILHRSDGSDRIRIVPVIFTGKSSDLYMVFYPFMFPTSEQYIVVRPVHVEDKMKRGSE